MVNNILCFKYIFLFISIFYIYNHAISTNKWLFKLILYIYLETFFSIKHYIYIILANLF